jgi:hypothetical protein
MDIKQFDRIAATLAQPHSRRNVVRLFGAAVAAGGIGVLGVSESEARRRRRRKNKGKGNGNGNQPQPAEPAADIAITSITIETTGEANHDNAVVQFANIGNLPSGAFRIGLIAIRDDGTVRNEVFSVPFTLAPGATGTEKFRLGCSWINGGTVTARTDPSPVAGELAANTANNSLSASFGGGVCS